MPTGYLIAVPFWQSLAIALIPTIAVSATAWQATRDLGLRRRLEGTDRFLEIASLANGRPRDGRPAVGTAEQCAAIELLAEFGRSEKHLKAAAAAALGETLEMLEGGDGVAVRLTVVARAALSRLN